jgi:hypothetical protein
MSIFSIWKKEPIKVTEQDINNFNECNKALVDLKNALAPYHVDIKTNVTNSKAAARLYIDYFLMSAALDAFYIRNRLEFKKINEVIYNRIPRKDYLFKLKIVDNQKAVNKLSRLGLLERIETVDKNNLKYKITEAGVKAMQQQTFQTLAASAFYNYQTYKLNRKMLWMSLCMLLTAIVSIVVSVIAILKTK